MAGGFTVASRQAPLREEVMPENSAPRRAPFTPSDGPLIERVSQLIEQTRTTVAIQANAALTLLNWHIGRMIDVEVLKESRADYGRQIVATLSQQLTQRFGRGFDRTNLTRMVRFAQAFPDLDIVASLARRLSWSHFLALLPVRPEARDFYTKQATTMQLSVRALRELIGRQGYERNEIANTQDPDGAVVPLDSFRDPYFLDFLGLNDAYTESDLEDAIIRDLEPFLLEVGDGWAFVARQKRMPVGDDDFFLDLLFFSRPLRRLIAVELKISKFKPSFKGQMDLYLKWLDKYERREGENTPIGLILCTEASREQIELLELNKDGIVVAEYWTTLPPKAELEARITAIYRDAQERLARRQLDASEGGQRSAPEEA
ncbi:PDDEXK nuclease domain-containing protein [Microbacterium sp.]|uniref:PDDEXK nuclease domain-containing protein n=1 Tax=Microbacterium sp. TaxID=51671 RepID=UPI003C78E6E8